MAVCPLGSAALAGTAFPIDRVSLAQALGLASARALELEQESVPVLNPKAHRKYEL